MIIDLKSDQGNAFYIMAIVKNYLEENNIKPQEYLEKAMSSDYEHLLNVSKECYPDLIYVNRY